MKSVNSYKPFYTGKNIPQLLNIHTLVDICGGINPAFSMCVIYDAANNQVRDQINEIYII
jgi:hypothetical protein